MGAPTVSVEWIPRGDEVPAVVPDLICIVDRETAEPVITEILRYGLRVAILEMPASRMLTTPEALAAVGPKVFAMTRRMHRYHGCTSGMPLLGSSSLIDHLPQYDDDEDSDHR